MCFTISEYPLILEEPRRAIIALEMYFSGDYLQPTINGEEYYRKPPLYNALMAFFFHLFNEQGEWVVRLITTISFLLWPLLLFFITKNELGHKTALVASVFLGISFDTYFFYSRLAEIDIFYSVVSLPIFLWSWKWARNSSKWKFFVIVPIYGSFTFFIKGAPALPFTLISMISMAFFYWGKHAVTWKWSVSFVLFIFTPILYFLYMDTYTESNVSKYLNTLFFESAGRADAESLNTFLVHLLKFPLHVFLILLPASFVLFGLVKNPLSKSSDFRALSVLFILNFALYWLVEGARVRYIYPLIPLAFLAISKLFTEWNWHKWLGKQVKPFFTFFILFFSTSLILYAFKYKIQLSLSLLWLAVGLSLFLFWLGFLKRQVVFTGLTIIISAKIAFSFVLANEQKNASFEAQYEKELAENFYLRTFIYPSLYYNSGYERHYNFLYVLSKNRQQILRKDTAYSDPDGTYVINIYQRYVAPKNQLLETIPFKNEEYYCIRLR